MSVRFSNLAYFDTHLAFIFVTNLFKGHISLKTLKTTAHKAAKKEIFL
jgi:hypothetical protein